MFTPVVHYSHERARRDNDPIMSPKKNTTNHNGRDNYVMSKTQELGECFQPFQENFSTIREKEFIGLTQ